MISHIDIIGIGNSGKGAVVDLLREVNGVLVQEAFHEMNIVRFPGGLYDLFTDCEMSHTPTRADVAVDRFSLLVDRLGGEKGFLGWLRNFKSAGFAYDYFYTGFTRRSQRLIEDLTLASYEGLKPWILIDKNPIKFWKIRLRNKFKSRGSVDNIRLIDKSKIKTLCQEYFIDILSSSRGYDNQDIVITNNAFDFELLEKKLNLFTRSKAIVVVRDPRDSYLNMLFGNEGIDNKFDSLEISGLNILGVNDIHIYSEYQKRLLMMLKDLMHERILIVDFNNLVYNYDVEVPRILNFIGLSRENHVRPKVHFNPDKSKLMTDKWPRFYGHQNAMQLKRNLKDCWFGWRE